MVSGFEVVKNFRASGMVHLARRQRAGPAAEQLAFHVWPVRVEARSEYESVLLPLFLSRAAGLELAQSGSGKGYAGRDALLVQARRFRIPPGCRGYAIRRSEAHGQSSLAGHR